MSRITNKLRFHDIFTPNQRKVNLVAKKTKEEEVISAPLIERTSKGLREALFDELDALRNGKSNANRAIAVSKVACQVINSVKMEIEYQKHVAASPTGTDFMNNGASLRLGSAAAA